MSVTLATLSIITALAIGAVSPGPSFILVARTAAISGRHEALATALGLGSGAFLFAVMALAGLHAVFNAVPLVYTALKIGGGLYLIFLATQIWRGARKPLPSTAPEEKTPQRNLLRAYFVGLATQLSNPKTAIVFASVFAALMPEQPPVFFYFIVPVAALVVDAGWFAIVACALSSATPRSIYLHYKPSIDRLAGSIMGLLGLKLISMASSK